MVPIFLTLEEVIEVHTDQINRYGGTLGIRDHSLLDSALRVPEAGFGEEYLHSDLFEMAAAYLFHIVQNHPFIDGNKRVGAVTALVFLEMNGIATKISNTLLAKTVLDIAQGKKGKAAVADFLQKHSRPKQGS